MLKLRESSDAADFRNALSTTKSLLVNAHLVRLISQDVSQLLPLVKLGSKDIPKDIVKDCLTCLLCVSGQIECRDSAAALLSQLVSQSLAPFFSSEDSQNALICLEMVQKLSEKLDDNEDQPLLESLWTELVKLFSNYNQGSLEAQKHLFRSIILLSPKLAQTLIQKNHDPIKEVLEGLLRRQEAELRRLAGPFLGSVWTTLQETQVDSMRSSLLKQALEDCLSDIEFRKMMGYRLLSILCQVSPDIGSKILQNESQDSKAFLDLSMGTLLNTADSDMQKAILEALSSASGNAVSRTLILGHCTPDLIVLEDKLLKDSDTSAILTILLTKLSVGSEETESSSQLLAPEKLFDKVSLAFTTTPTEDVRSLLVEALVVLTTKPLLREKICADSMLLKSCVKLLEARATDKTLVYGLCSIFMSTGSYRPILSKEEQQMQKLKNMAQKGSKLTEKEDPLESPEYVAKRNIILAKTGLVSTLPALTKSASEALLKVLATLLLNMSASSEIRGLIVQQGAIRTLLTLLASTKESEPAFKSAAQALARILISSDPTIVFKGNQALECVSPLLTLCRGDDGLAQFEAMLALTNLASLGDSLQTKILASSGISTFESLIFSDNVLTRRAAIECLCNLMPHPTVMERYATSDKSQRLKLLVALSDVEDFGTRRAASGCLAILSGVLPGAEALIKEVRLLEVLDLLIKDPSEELQHRGLAVIENIAYYVPTERSNLLTKFETRLGEMERRSPGKISPQMASLASKTLKVLK